MAEVWHQFWFEVVHAARQAPRMYFAPLRGAIRETRAVLHQIEMENRARWRESSHRGRGDR